MILKSNKNILFELFKAVIYAFQIYISFYIFYRRRNAITFNPERNLKLDGIFEKERLLKNYRWKSF